MALELLKITGSQPYYLNNGNVPEELVRALEDYMRTGTQIIFKHDGDDCILTSYEYNTDENKVIAYFVTPKKKLLKVDIGAGWDLVITESEFTPETDTTLTQSGKPADAKKTGERFMVFEENVLGYMDEIRDLISSMGLKPQEKTIDITENGTVEVTPDDGYIMSKVTANVNVKGVDKIQRYIELNGNSARNLFYSFTGTSVDELMDGIDTSKITTTGNMFDSCSNLTTVPLFDTSNATSMASMFSKCSNLTTVPLFDTSKVTSMAGMFSGCSKLTTVPLFDTSKVTDIGSLFVSCSNLTTVPLFDTSNATNMSYMFNGCSNLTTVPLFDTSKVTSATYMFTKCSKLTTVPFLDIRNLTSMSYFFSGCNNLTECWIRNIKTNLQVGNGSGTSSSDYGHLLTLESLLHLCKECRKTASSLTLTVGTANLNKLNGIYVKLIDITDEMMAEDDLIDQKYPFVQCESTDADAMTIQDYMALKKWSLA